MAKKWDISRRRVTTLCAEGRIEGAILKGNTWLIPENTEKPDDPRRVRKIEQKKCQHCECIDLLRTTRKIKSILNVFITQENGGQSMKLVVYKGFNEEFLSMVKEEPLVDGTIATKLNVLKFDKKTIGYGINFFRGK